ncbi:CLAVATA3/ESR (CLE)-related protein 46 isoform X2 [Telopea speciosissima]|uniref:CLAVATA3/ESR (CLE)-related protein 46 isoform X2 n=1 Tax=Telopea speciosissima TaxID=54955 RepID=UPI001CC7F3E5|nr:CLAVATA3/ESR (CLE)-related protein 46 isoform X2 [Telopea speciosissima]
MQKLPAKMRGRQSLVHLLLAFILLAVAASNSHFSNPITVQAVETAAFRHGSAEPGSHPSSGSTLAIWENTRKMTQGRKTHKVPSGPSPVGNRHPPTRP